MKKGRKVLKKRVPDMCDGRLVQKLIQYDIENAQEKKETWGEYENPDMSDLHNVEVEIVKKKQ